MQNFNSILLLTLPLAWFILYNYDKSIINIINGKRYKENLKQIELKNINNKVLRLIHDLAICLLFFTIILSLLIYENVILGSLTAIICIMLLIVKSMLFMKSIESR